MIDIPEEKFRKKLCNLLLNELPKSIIEYEEESEDHEQLSTFRFVGDKDDLPVGVEMPYVVITVEEGHYLVKDRIIHNTLFKITLEMKLRIKLQFSIYCYLIKKILIQDKNSWHVIEYNQVSKYLICEICLKI